MGLIYSGELVAITFSWASLLQKFQSGFAVNMVIIATTIVTFSNHLKIPSTFREHHVPSG